MAPFNENLRGAKMGDHKDFDVQYPADYPDPKLAGKNFIYAVEVLGIKQKKLPGTERRIRQGCERRAIARRTARQGSREPGARARSSAEGLCSEKVLAELVKLHDFPVPEALVEHQMDVRLERMVRSLATQGVDPRAVNVDWVSCGGSRKIARSTT